MTQFAEYSSVSYQKTFFSRNSVSFSKLRCRFHVTNFFESYSTHLQSSVETVIKCALAFSIARLLGFIPYMFFFFTSCLNFLWIYFQLNCRRSVNSCLKKLIETHINVHRHKIYYSSNILEHKVIVILLRVVSHHHFALKIRSPVSVKSRLLFYKKCVYTFRYYIHHQWMFLFPTPDFPPCRLLWPIGW